MHAPDLRNDEAILVWTHEIQLERTAHAARSVDGSKVGHCGLLGAGVTAPQAVATRREGRGKGVKVKQVAFVGCIPSLSPLLGC
jgi:hypothetical protein